jgi:hypothetical protein
VELDALGDVELEVLGALLVEDEVLGSVVDDELVPPAPLLLPDVPPVCAMAKPPMASAAAAANVVSVFLVVVMCVAP